jgi:cytochrome c553
MSSRSEWTKRAILTALIAGSVGFGKEKSAACAMCHGPEGQGTQMAPKIAGKDPTWFVQALNDYKSGARDNAMMKAQAAQLTPDDEANLAAYYAALK